MARNRERDALIVRNVKKFMVEAGNWSSATLAAVMGMTEGQLAKIFSSYNGAELHVHKFAAAFDRSADDFDEEDPAKQKPMAPPVFFLKIRPQTKADPMALAHAMKCLAEANRMHQVNTQQKKR